MVTNAATAESDIVLLRSFERLAIIFCAKNCEKTIAKAIASIRNYFQPDLALFCYNILPCQPPITIRINGGTTYNTDSSAYSKTLTNQRVTVDTVS
jgi:hypothetical protein